MMPRPTTTTVHLLIGVVVLPAICIGLIALVGHDPAGDEKTDSSGRFEYDLAKYMHVDPKLVHYEQVREIDLAMKIPRAVSVGPSDSIYLAGDQQVTILDRSGRRIEQFDLDGLPWCLAVAGGEHAFPGRVYVGFRDHVESFSPDGRREAIWPSLGGRTVLTSIGVDEENVYLADAGNKVVIRCDVEGRIINRIGRRDPARNVPGFVIPSPYFDLVMGMDGLLRVVNPGGHTIEAYTPDGDMELAWGKPGLAIDAFCGCCNPVNMAILPDGNLVTAEKGVPRVKEYTSTGQFVSVVAAPDALLPTATAAVETRPGHKLLVVDLATDSGGRILVLDPTARKLRIFEKIEVTPKTP